MCERREISFHPLTGQSGKQVLSQQKLSDLVSEVDPKQVLDEDVEEVSQTPRYIKLSTLLQNFKNMMFLHSC